MIRWASASGRPIKLGTMTSLGLFGTAIGVAWAGTTTAVGVGVAVGGTGVGVGGSGVGVGSGADCVGRVPSMNQSVMVERPGTGRRPVWASTTARTSPGGRAKARAG